MKVEIWSDIICPYCYIGKRRFESALREFTHRDQVNVVHRSFQLEPTTPLHPDKHLFELAAIKHGTSIEAMAREGRAVSERAKQDGLIFNYSAVKHTNTLDAHRFVHYAREFGKEEVVLESLYRAYFTDSLHIGEHDTLLALAEEAGLDREKTAAMLLDSKRYENSVKEEQLAAGRLGVQGVPYFLINDCYAISGAQPAIVFIKALEAAWDEEKQASINDGDTGICTGEMC